MRINPIFERLALLTGSEGFKKLTHSSVLVFGAGGVGSWAAEALVRSGIGKIGIIDNDIACASNINRQTEATALTLGLPKASALKKHLLEINPECEITAFDVFYSRGNENLFCIEESGYVIDAIDSLNHKLDLIEKVTASNATLFSSMGMALKLDPSLIKASSIWKTEGCPLARLVRQGLRKRGFKGDFTAVYSNEERKSPLCEVSPGFSNEASGTEDTDNVKYKKRFNGSIVTVTAAAGLLLANLVIRHVINK
jgi:tRNA A37 threonylcarbamoyladenosine dehydratase